MDHKKTSTAQVLLDPQDQSLSDVTAQDRENICRPGIGRIHELDLLRGFFILVIVIDHFQRWPSPFTYLTGQGRLWVSAAEGFFIISGLLVGYLRVWKGRHRSLGEISKKMLSRAAKLYLWSVGITLFVVGIMPFFTTGNDSIYALLPKFPDATQLTSQQVYIWNVITGRYASDWIYFLRMYAIILVVSPPVIWLIRRRKWWVVLLLSLATYSASLMMETPEAVMQWQILFFGAALIGWRLESIAAWLLSHPVAARRIAVSLICTTLLTMIMSYFWVHGWSNVEGSRPIISRDSYVTTRGFIDPWFTNNPLALGRIILSFIWFGGLFSIFHYARDFIMKAFGWLLMPFGTAALRVYCLQAILFVFLQALIPISQSQVFNMLSTTAVVLIVWGIIRTPIAQKILPR